MTPLEINFLLHCYVSPIAHPEIDSVIMQETINDFINEDLIEATNFDYVWDCTERGRAYIHMLTNLDLPRQKTVWVDEHGLMIPYVKPLQ